MTTTYNSAFSDAFHVRDIVENPEVLRDALYDNLNGAFIDDAVLLNGGTVTSNAFAYFEDSPVSTADEAERKAEFADIVTTSALRGDKKYAEVYTNALGIDISREMIRYNDSSELQRQVSALQNSLVSKANKELFGAIDAAGSNTVQATAKINEPEASPVDDIVTAQISVAEAEQGGINFNYNADTIILNRSAYSRIIKSKDMQPFFQGNLADINFRFTGENPVSLLGMRVLVTSHIKPGEAYVLDSTRAGFYREADPLTITDLYSTNGENEFGGANHAWRIDAFRTRGLAIAAPKAITKITGLL